MPQDETPPIITGITNYGGTHYVGNQAVGPNAHASSDIVGFDLTPTRRARAAELLDQVERLVSEHESTLADPAATRRELRRLRDELDEKEPQSSVLQRALDQLKAFAQPVTPLIAAIAQLAQAIHGS